MYNVFAGISVRPRINALHFVNTRWRWNAEYVVVAQAYLPGFEPGFD